MTTLPEDDGARTIDPDRNSDRYEYREQDDKQKAGYYDVFKGFYNGPPTADWAAGQKQHRGSSHLCDLCLDPDNPEQRRTVGNLDIKRLQAINNFEDQVFRGG